MGYSKNLMLNSSGKNSILQIYYRRGQEMYALATIIIIIIIIMIIILTIFIAQYIYKAKVKGVLTRISCRQY